MYTNTPVHLALVPNIPEEEGHNKLVLVVELEDVQVVGSGCRRNGWSLEEENSFEVVAVGCMIGVSSEIYLWIVSVCNSSLGTK